jgi:hypothetical protein
MSKTLPAAWKKHRRQGQCLLFPAHGRGKMSGQGKESKRMRGDVPIYLLEALESRFRLIYSLGAF